VTQTRKRTRKARMEGMEFCFRQVVTQLFFHIDERDRKLQEQENFHQQERSDWEDIEKALHCQIKKLKEGISIKESYREKVRDLMEVEKALRGQIKQLKKKNSEMVRPNGETERRT